MGVYAEVLMDAGAASVEVMMMVGENARPTRAMSKSEKAPFRLVGRIVVVVGLVVGVGVCAPL